MATFTGYNNKVQILVTKNRNFVDFVFPLKFLPFVFVKSSNNGGTF